MTDQTGEAPDVLALRDQVSRFEERLTGLEKLLRLQIDHQKERTENRHRQMAEFRDLVRGLDERVRDVERGLSRRGMS